MTVPSLQFLTFVIIAAGLYNLPPLAAWHRLVLLVINVAFLLTFSHDPVALLPLVGFLVFGFAAVRMLQGGERRDWFVPFLLVTIFAFAWLKQYAFIPHSLFLEHPYVTIGLSYIFFRVLHLIIDGHQGVLGSRLGALDYVNYALNFTSLVSGPIQRYQDYRLQQDDRPPLDQVVIVEAFERMALGFFKVVLLSALLANQQQVAIDSFKAEHGPSAQMLIAAVIVGLYPLYLYFNFSGYVDVVIGAARLFRMNLPENFNAPFFAENFIDFWARWHMTLSNWLRTYVFTPLLMSLMRRFPAPGLEQLLGAFALFVTFFLVGLWHGRTSEFLFFGVLQGGGVSGVRLYQIGMDRFLGKKGYRSLRNSGIYRMFARGLTFSWFALTLLWFWSTWDEIGKLGQGLGAGGVVGMVLIVFAAAALVLSAGAAIRERADSIGLFFRPSVRVTLWTFQMVALVTLKVLLEPSAPAVIYRDF